MTAIQFERGSAWDTTKDIFRRFGIYIVLVLIVIASSIMNENFLTSRNLTNVVRAISVVMMIACAEQLAITAGMIDLSPGSVVAFAGVVSTGVFVSTQSVVLGLLAGTGVGAACGLVNGIILTRYGIPPFIVTLAMQTVARGLALVYTNGVPISNLGAFKVLGQGFIGPIPVPVLILAIVLFITWFILTQMRLGRYIYAIGGNEEAAVATGINVKRVKLLAYVIGGFFIGLAGVVLMSRVNSGQPSIGIGYEFDAITAVVVGGTSLNGGKGSILGTIAGGLIVGIINNMLNLQNVSSYYQIIAKGVIIALAVILDVKTKGGNK